MAVFINHHWVESVKAFMERHLQVRCQGNAFTPGASCQQTGVATKLTRCVAGFLGGLSDDPAFDVEHQVDPLHRLQRHDTLRILGNPGA